MQKLTDDPVVNEVIGKFMARSEEGMRTYGVSMADNNAPAVEWIEQAQQEAMDFVLYLERLKQELINGRQVRFKNTPKEQRREDILDKDRGRFSNEGEGWVQSEFRGPPDTAA
tara:strand:- start:177 stop:515 length:339 start_codon:yes stop_codon:yes gene_type:complete